ncbi:hypothetical protein MNB_SM-5-255 [hydrothermal vent metagenome]|uniref:Carrier domain-containing protein n=1 Tax=hydrothermal vent metagenome TaxID=652676 RepID=A0A1W1CSD0_9ZZZZ
MSKYEKFLVDYIIEKNGIDINSININNNMFEQGYIDSLGIFTLFVLIEEEFDIDMSLDDVANFNIKTIKQLAQFIQSKSVL